MVRVECSASKAFLVMYINIFRIHDGVSITHDDPVVELDFLPLEEQRRRTDQAED